MAVYARLDQDLQVVELIETGDYEVADLFAQEYLSALVPVPTDTNVVLGGRVERRGEEVVFYPPSRAESERSTSRGRVWRDTRTSKEQGLLLHHQGQGAAGSNRNSLLRSFLSYLSIGRR